MKILAALDDDDLAGRVLETAVRLSELFQTELEAIHAGSGQAGGLESRAQSAGVPFRLVPGLAVDALARALGGDQIVLGVLGARRRAGGGPPVGTTALTIIQQVPKPLVVIPHGAAAPRPGPMERVLLPLDGSPVAARAVEDTVRRLSAFGLQIIVLHVFDAERVPRFSDQPQHEFDAWEREFLARHCAAPGARLEARRGWAPDAVLEAAAAQDADMIALGWAQDLSAGRAAVVREVLGRASVPVILLPTEPVAISPGLRAHRGAQTGGEEGR